MTMKKSTAVGVAVTLLAGAALLAWAFAPRPLEVGSPRFQCNK